MYVYLFKSLAKTPNFISIFRVDVAQTKPSYFKLNSVFSSLSNRITQNEIKISRKCTAKTTKKKLLRLSSSDRNEQELTYQGKPIIVTALFPKHTDKIGKKHQLLSKQEIWNFSNKNIREIFGGNAFSFLAQVFVTLLFYNNVFQLKTQ